MKRASLVLFQISTISILGLFAQPATVPQLQTPAFNSQDLNPTLSQAQGAQSQAAWETIIQGGLAGLRATWEAAVNTQINTELLNVTQSDSVNNQAEYENYVRSALLSQMSAAESAWTSAAQNAIQTERQIFLAALSAADLKQAEQDAKAQTDALLNANPPNQSSDVFKDAGQKIADAKTAYEQGFNAQLANGLNQFGAAQGALDQNFDSFLAGLSQTEQGYQQNLQGIQAAEGNVRNAISTQVQGMQSYLQSSQLFYNTTCDAQGNNCVSAMNQAGTDLLTVITNLQTALQQNAPLSQLTQTMVDYLTAQQNVAYATEQTWQSQIDNDYNHSANLAFGGNWGNLNVDPEFTNIMAYIDGNTQPLLSQIGGPGKNVSITNVSLQGWSGGYNWALIMGGVWGDHAYYTANQSNPFHYGWNGISCLSLILCFPVGNNNQPEDYVNKILTYHVHDTIAEANAQTWSGYKNDLGGALATFTALQQASANWEAQVSQYQAQHAAWLATAQQDLINEQQAYNAASTQLTQSKNSWLQQMSEAHKAADIKFNAAAIDLAAAQNATQGGDAKAQQDAAKAALAGLPGYTPIQQPSLSNLISIINSVPSSSTHANDSASTGVPDFSLIGNLETKFGQTLGGLSNLAIAKTASDEAEHMKAETVRNTVANIKAQADAMALSLEHPEWSQSQISDQVKKNMEAGTVSDSSIQVTTDATGLITLTRMVANGKAALNSDGDPTNAEAYHPVLTQQTIHIAPPPTQKLASTGSLFSEWNLQSILDAQSDYQKQAQASLEKANTMLDAANNVVATNLNNFHKDAQRQAAEASQLKSLVTSLLTGGTVESWVQGQVRGNIAGAIASATGMPAGLVSGLLGGLSPEKATEQMLTDMAWDSLSAAVGNADLVSMFRQQFQANEDRKRRVESQRPGLGDFVTMGASYVQRNAQYSPTLAKVNTVMNMVPGMTAFANVGAAVNEGGLKALPKAIVGGITEFVGTVASGIKHFAQGKISVETIGEMSGVPASSFAALPGRLAPPTRSQGPLESFMAYSGLDNYGRSMNQIAARWNAVVTKPLFKAMGDLGKQIAENTLRPVDSDAADKLKMKRDLDFGKAARFTDMMFNPLDYLLRPLYASVGMARTYDNFWAPYKKATKSLKDNLTSTYAQSPVFLQLASLMSGGWPAYFTEQAVEGYQEGGWSGAFAKPADTWLAGLQYFGIDAGIGYTYGEGWSGNLGIGFEGVSVGLDYSDSEGLGVSAGIGAGGTKVGGRCSLKTLHCSANASVGVGPVAVKYDTDQGFGVSAGYGPIGINYSARSGLSASIGGLSYNFKTGKPSFDAGGMVSLAMTMNANMEALNAVNAANSATLAFGGTPVDVPTSSTGNLWNLMAGYPGRYSGSGGNGGTSSNNDWNLPDVSLSGMWNSISSGASNLWNGVKTTFGSASGLAGAANSVTGSVAGFFGQIQADTATGWDKFLNGLAPLAAVGAGLATLGSAAMNGVKNTKESLVNLIVGDRNGEHHWETDQEQEDRLYAQFQAEMAVEEARIDAAAEVEQAGAAIAGAVSQQGADGAPPPIPPEPVMPSLLVNYPGPEVESQPNGLLNNTVPDHPPRELSPEDREFANGIIQRYFEDPDSVSMEEKQAIIDLYLAAGMDDEAERMALTLGMYVEDSSAIENRQPENAEEADWASQSNDEDAQYGNTPAWQIPEAELSPDIQNLLWATSQGAQGGLASNVTEIRKLLSDPTETSLLIAALKEQLRPDELAQLQNQDPTKTANQLCVVASFYDNLRLLNAQGPGMESFTTFYLNQVLAGNVTRGTDGSFVVMNGDPGMASAARMYTVADPIDGNQIPLRWKYFSSMEDFSKTGLGVGMVNIGSPTDNHSFLALQRTDGNFQRADVGDASKWGDILTSKATTARAIQSRGNGETKVWSVFGLVPTPPSK
ncbi:MAG: TIGR04388 family protein [Leptospirales bacterium]|nr:TIGR04388 family protein [Leptospirales bacterium]